MLVLLPTFFQVSAQDYKPLIREDRVWECLKVGDDFVYLIKYMRFEGSLEFDGKTYHRLVTFGSVKLNWDIDHNMFLYDLQDNLSQIEGFMREEGGKVYTLLLNHSENCRKSNQLYGVDSDAEDEDSWISEFLIYDYNCEVGDSYITKDYAGFSWDIPIKVKEVSETMVDGEVCKVQEIVPMEADDLYPLPVIEGIGIGTAGCLNFQYLWGAPTRLWYHNRINRVFNKDKEVIYNNPDWIFDFPYPEFSSVGVPEDDKADNKAIYDILGRRINSAAPGQIYICGGKKHIAPIR